MRPYIITIRLTRSKQHVQTVKHWYTKVKTSNEGFCVIYDLVSIVSEGQTYVFTQTKKLIEEISQFLIDKGVSCKAFSSNLTPQERNKTLDEFHNNEFKVLVCSDVLARGIDAPNAYLVINYKIPFQFVPIAKNRYIYKDQNQSKNEKRAFPNCYTYYHRAGRAGRFGKSGICFTIVTDDKDENNLKMFCSSLNLNIPFRFIECKKVGNLSSCKDESENEGDDQTGIGYVNDSKNDQLFEYDLANNKLNHNDNENHADIAMNFNGCHHHKQNHFQMDETDYWEWNINDKIKDVKLENNANNTVQELKEKTEKLNRIVEFQNNQIEVLQNDLLEQRQRFTSQIDHLNQKYLQLEKMIKNIFSEQGQKK